MYRWPIELASDGRSTEHLQLLVPPRGAAFTFTCLLHLGHPVHLALIDAYLHGTVPFPPGASLGQDSRAIVASLAGLLVTLHESGHTRAGLSDVMLLRPSRGSAGCSRFLVRAPDRTSIRLSCRSSRRGAASDHGAEPGWDQVVTIVPPPRAARRHAIERREPITLAALRIPSDRGLLQATPHPNGPAEHPPRGPDQTSNLQRRPLRAVLSGAGDLLERVPAGATWNGLSIDLGLSPEPAGGSTLALLPRPAGEIDAVPLMLEATWATLEALLGRSVEERRTEPITLRLVGPGRSTELLIGWSLVLPRNRRVFAAWLGSDGRALVRLTGSELEK